MLCHKGNEYKEDSGKSKWKNNLLFLGIWKKLFSLSFPLSLKLVMIETEYNSYLRSVLENWEKALHTLLHMISILNSERVGRFGEESLVL